MLVPGLHPFQEPSHVPSRHLLPQPALQADTPPWLQRYNPGQAFLLIEQKQLLLNQPLPPDALITPIFRLRRLLSSWVQHVVLPLHLPHGIPR